MANSKKVKEKLFEIIESMDAKTEKFVVNPDKDFTRKTKLSLSDMMKFFIVSKSSSFKGALLQFYNYSTSAPSQAAFCQKRSKILSLAFTFIMNEVNHLFKPKKLYKNKYSLIACDGTQFTLFRNPDDKKTYTLKKDTAKGGHNLLHVTAAYDLLNMRFIDAVMRGIKERSEHEAIRIIMDRFDPICGIPIFIADRGFASYALYIHAVLTKRLLLVRVKESSFRALLNSKYEENAIIDKTISFKISESIDFIKSFPVEYQNVYRKIRTVWRQQKDLTGVNEDTITLRLVSAPGKNGEKIYIITTLPEDEFNTHSILNLYKQRWDIESSFDYLKNVLGAERFHSKKVAFIEQEILSSLIKYNICTIISQDVKVPKVQRGHPYKLNYSMVFRIVMDFLSDKEMNPFHPEDNIAKHICPIRKDRIFRWGGNKFVKFTFYHPI